MSRPPHPPRLYNSKVEEDEVGGTIYVDTSKNLFACSKIIHVMQTFMYKVPPPTEILLQLTSFSLQNSLIYIVTV
jgi:hypothetical protein